MTTYYVEWHTSVGVGATYYDGVETVNAEDEDEAKQRARFNVHRRAFTDWPVSHIIVGRASTSLRGIARWEDHTTEDNS